MDHPHRKVQSGSDRTQLPTHPGSSKSRSLTGFVFAAVLMAGAVAIAAEFVKLVPISLCLLTLCLGGTCIVVGFGGLVGLRTRSTRAPVRRSTPRTAHATPTEFVEPIDDLPLVHTLVTISTPVTTIGSGARFDAPGEIVLNSGRKGDSNTTVPLPGSPNSARFSLRTQIDNVLFERLEEYKSLRPREGCVLLVTETAAKHGDADSPSAYLNGAVATISLAHMIAASRDIPTLVIDTGSEVWSRFPEHELTADAPDILAFPRVPGVFDIISERSGVDDWVILEEDLPSLTAISAGRIPSDWPDTLCSEGMRRMIAEARRLADVTIVYAPRAAEHPEVVRALAELSNGVLIASTVDTESAAAEVNALRQIFSESVIVLGRIALVDAAASSRVVPSAVNHSVGLR